MKSPCQSSDSSICEESLLLLEEGKENFSSFVANKPSADNLMSGGLTFKKEIPNLH
jgi:hypothetical protein